MSRLPNASTNNEEILNDIQDLQKMEQEMFDILETRRNLTPAATQMIFKNINDLSQVRINLYETLGGVNNYFQRALNNTQGTLRAQSMAIEIVENQLNEAKRKLAALEEERNNKIRLVQINTYYSDRYAAQTWLMKLLIMTLIPMIILAILHNKGILSNTIFYLLIVIVSLIGGWFIVKTWLSIISRDNMNYREFNWGAAPAESTSTTEGEESNPWETDLTTCVGEECCDETQTYDSTENKCVSAESFKVGSMAYDPLNYGASITKSFGNVMPSSAKTFGM
jgi:hypothetical protein